MLRGIDVVLYEKHQTGEDAFHAPVYEETPMTVHNVLVGAPDTAAIVNELTLTGRRLAYTLALPKGCPRLAQCDGRVFRAEIPHLRGCGTGHRKPGAAGMEQTGKGGTVWLRLQKSN